MVALTCDICGGKLVMGTGGIAVCDSCGMEHSKDRMQEKVQEIKGTVEVINIASIDSLLKRGQLELENSQWDNAYNYFNKVLDINPENISAYIGCLCACVNVRNEEMLGEGKEPLSNYSIFKNALKFANKELKAKLKEYDEKIKLRITNKNTERNSTLARNRKIQARFQNCISAYGNATLGLKSDGTVVAVGENNQVFIRNQRDIVAIAAGDEFSLGLKSDGTVIGFSSAKIWRDIVAIAAGYKHAVGLKSDGTVISGGDINLIERGMGNKFGELNTESWRDIVAITARDYRTFGLKSNGTVVAVGKNEYGECNTENWRDIVMISAGYEHTVGLKSDGTVVAVGKNEYGECDTSKWRDIVAITAGYGFTLGLKINCTVVVIGRVSDRKSEDCKKKIENWQEILAIAAGYYHAVGLKKDGTVVAVGEKIKDEYEIRTWRDIGPVPEEQVVKSRLKLEERRRWIQEGLCQYCGGEIGGLFTKKCKSCGEEHFGD